MQESSITQSSQFRQPQRESGEHSSDMFATRSGVGEDVIGLLLCARKKARPSSTRLKITPARLQRISFRLPDFSTQYIPINVKMKLPNAMMAPNPIALWLSTMPAILRIVGA